MSKDRIDKFNKADIIFLGTIIRYKRFSKKLAEYNGFNIGNMNIRPEGRENHIGKVVYSSYGKLIQQYRYNRSFSFKIKELQDIYWKNPEYQIEGFLPTEENLWLIFGYLMRESTNRFFFKNRKFELKMFESMKFSKNEEDKILAKLKTLWKRGEA